MFLLVTIKSFTVEGFIDIDTSHASKLISSLAWLDVQFNCPTNSLYCGTSSTVKELSLDILLSLLISTSFDSSEYVMVGLNKYILAFVQYLNFSFPYEWSQMTFITR